jgi:hypothetical protein
MLRLGDTAPDFAAETTEGKIQFHQWLGDTWGIRTGGGADAAHRPRPTTHRAETRERRIPSGGRRAQGAASGQRRSHVHRRAERAG